MCVTSPARPSGRPVQEAESAQAVVAECCSPQPRQARGGRTPRPTVPSPAGPGAQTSPRTPPRLPSEIGSGRAPGPTGPVSVGGRETFRLLNCPVPRRPWRRALWGGGGRRLCQLPPRGWAFRTRLRAVLRMSHLPRVVRRHASGRRAFSAPRQGPEEARARHPSPCECSSVSRSSAKYQLDARLSKQKAQQVKREAEGNCRWWPRPLCPCSGARGTWDLGSAGQSRGQMMGEAVWSGRRNGEHLALPSQVPRPRASQGSLAGLAKLGGQSVAEKLRVADPWDAPGTGVVLRAGLSSRASLAAGKSHSPGVSHSPSGVLCLKVSAIFREGVARASRPCPRQMCPLQACWPGAHSGLLCFWCLH